MAWRIMIVDDEDDVRLIIKTTLSPKYEVLEAHDGLDALEKIERYEPDFIIMDVMMPLMNGFEACQSIRKSQHFHDIPVMFLSALGSREDMKKGYSSGANLYLTKPFDPDRLLKNVDIFFEKTPPPQRKKRRTIQQIQRDESSGRVPAAPGSVEFLEEKSPKKPAAASSREQAPASPPGLKPRVMVVDDDHEICDLIKMTLMDICEVTFASDGMQAIERLVKYQPDMLIIDIMLPKMNGYQLLQSLRSNRAFLRMPIMMCSAKGADRDINMARRIGADDYLVKPFSGTELIEKVGDLQKRPGFQVKPKNYTIEHIMQMEAPREAEDVFKADDEAKREDRSARVLGKFLAREGDKEAFDTEKEDDKEGKKRRRFGFGGKE